MVRATPVNRLRSGALLAGLALVGVALGGCSNRDAALAEKLGRAEQAASRAEAAATRAEAAAKRAQNQQPMVVQAEPEDPSQAEDQQDESGL
jgi:hypothetical protein